MYIYLHVFLSDRVLHSDRVLPWHACPAEPPQRAFRDHSSPGVGPRAAPKRQLMHVERQLMDVCVSQTANLKCFCGGIDFYPVCNQEIKSLQAKSKGRPGNFSWCSLCLSFFLFLSLFSLSLSLSLSLFSLSLSLSPPATQPASPSSSLLLYSRYKS